MRANQPLADRFSLCFGQRFGLADDLIAGRRCHCRSCRSSRRFTARLNRLGRGAQLCQNSRHGAAHLLRGASSRRTFPRSPLDLLQRASQDQLILGNRHHVTPTLKLLGGTQARTLPQEALLVKTIAMLLTVASLVSVPHLPERQRLLAVPQKPTHALFAGWHTTLGVEIDASAAQTGEWGA